MAPGEEGLEGEGGEGDAGAEAEAEAVAVADESVLVSRR